MDPNATLKELRENLNLLSRLDVVDGTDQSLVDLVQDVADGFEILDEWLMDGGFLPNAWER